MTDTTTRASHWSVTINNPTQDDEDYMELARQRGWKIDGQKERGKEGTEHYQLHVTTPQVRFSAVKKAFPRAHIEVARNVTALQQYVNKEDTRVAPLVASQDKYPSQKRFFELIWDVILATPSEYWFLKLDPPRYGSFIGAERPHRLAYWKACAELIGRGYVVEGMGVNPQSLACWDRFHRALLRRKMSPETTSQPDIPAFESHISVPVVEYTHATQEVISQETRQSSPQIPPGCTDPLRHVSGWEHASCPVRSP